MADEMADRLRSAMHASAGRVEPGSGAIDDVARRARRQHVMRRAATGAAALVLVAAAAAAAVAVLPGGSEPDVVLEPGPSPTASTPPSDEGGEDELVSATCTDTAGGFAIDYPAGWNHTAVTDGSECRLFDPEPIELPELANDDVNAAVILDHLPQSYDEHLELSADAPSSEVVDEEHTTLDGRRARRRETVATGEAMFPEGARTVSWTIDLDGQTLVVSTSDHNVDGDFDEHVEIVDAMAASVRPIAPEDASPGEAGLGGEQACSAADADPGSAAEQPDLPGEVAETRAAILEAAAACDVDRLAELASDEQFTFTYGPGEDPAAHWRGLEADGHTPLQRLVDVLATDPATREVDGRTQFLWPAAHAAESWSDAPAEDRAAVEEFAAADDLATFRQADAYLGYRAVIRADGEWTVFVSGD